MKKIIVVSDDHGAHWFLDGLVREPHDLLIHLGNHGVPTREIDRDFDYHTEGTFNTGPEEKEIHFTFEGFKFFICHGWSQNINVFNYKERCFELSKTIDADVFLFGLTKIQYYEKINNKHFANPGWGENFAYLVITIDNGKIHFDLK